ncbi:hypothetical protein ACFSHT_10415 [Paraburkholderia silviterrae]|uniref:Minor tail T domain-containing protein n=2 Tax=Paraburkholderia silviterrae TaxID=2528715 RepID=A0A4R5MF06_9BURK|nr:hypothetical protein [Paraburkholderia silviterrae]TDG25363.1 hypothetical protein EYW47_05895 [Paraburkholderia silviterrae]
MAFYELEPWGSHYDDLRAGTIASMIANVHRDTKVRDKPFTALEMTPWNEHSRTGAAEPVPILLEDPEAQSNLLLTMMFPNKAA